jgi:hypothetical protein
VEVEKNKFAFCLISFTLVLELNYWCSNNKL